MKVVGIIYDGGFALAQIPSDIKGIIENTRNVCGKYYSNDADAYMALVCEHVHRNNVHNMVPVIPTYGDWKRKPFFLSPNMTNNSPITDGRIFVLLNIQFAGIYNDINLLINDFLYDENLLIIEARSELEAVNVINRFYKNRIFRVLPYINTKIPFITAAIPKNTLFNMPYVKLLETVITPEEIKGLNPLNVSALNPTDKNLLDKG